MAAYPKEKAVEVSRLLHSLDDDIENTTLSNTQRQNTLERLKTYGRDPAGCDAVFSASGINTVSFYILTGEVKAVKQEAMRCLANTLLLAPHLRPIAIELNLVVPIAKLYEKEDNNYEFLAGRILFLLTYEKTADFSELVSSHGLIESIASHLSRHAAVVSETQTFKDAIELMAMSETLKLLFNIADRLPTEISSLSITTPTICTLLIFTQIPPQPLEGLTSTIVNALAVLSFTALSTPAAAEEANAQYHKLIPQLIEILRLALAQYRPMQLDVQAVPLLTVLRKVYNASEAPLKRNMQRRLLPADAERVEPLGKSSSLASQLLRLTVEPGLSNLPEAVSSLMFELSDEDAAKFVRNIGYGYAAGYLMSHKIPIPESAHESQSDKDAQQIPINPITGQRLDKERATNSPDMTQEEKEREAERLFVLFERLKATGIVDVENPVRKAMQEGRFEEVDADSD